MDSYLLKVKNLVDNLKYCGYVLPQKDHVMYILSGLGSEYDPLVMTVNAKAGKPDYYTVEEVSSLLISLEKRVDKNSGDMLVNFVGNRGGYNSGGNRGCRSGFNNNRGTGNSTGRGNYMSNNRGGNNFRGNQNKPQCQLCLQFGHTVLTCFYRFDHSFTWPNFLATSGTQVITT